MSSWIKCLHRRSLFGRRADGHGWYQGRQPRDTISGGGGQVPSPWAAIYAVQPCSRPPVWAGSQRYSAEPLRKRCFSRSRPPGSAPRKGPFAHIPDPEPVRLGNIIRGERRNPGKWGRIWPLARAARLQARAEEHHVQRARGQQHEHQRDLQPVAGEFENRPHDLRMMERVRARVSNHIFDLGGRGFRTRLRVDSREPDREKAPEGAAHDPPTCGRFGAKIMRLQIV